MRQIESDSGSYLLFVESHVDQGTIHCESHICAQG